MARQALYSTLLFLGFLSAGAATAEPLTPELQRVRNALDRYQDPIAAVRDGYLSTLGCMDYPFAPKPGTVPYARGGMGIHFLNPGLIGPTLDPLKPQVLIYEPDGRKLKLVAAEYFVPLSTGVQGVPQLFGHRFDGPMAGHHPLMPESLAHYDLHVWLWKPNPSGMFSGTNPDLHCDEAAYAFKEEAPAILKTK
jgi:hypothetical protein